MSPTEKLIGALTSAAAWFREYENLHAAKGNLDGDVKARTNAERAEVCEAAIAAWNQRTPARVSPIEARRSLQAITREQVERQWKDAMPDIRGFATAVMKDSPMFCGFPCGQPGEQCECIDTMTAAIEVARTPAPVGDAETVARALAARGDCVGPSEDCGCTKYCRSLADAIQRALTAARTGAEGWRDIADAPRDGTWFLACATAPGWGATRIVRFAVPDDRLPINGEGVMWPSAPTHWQPLPAPPAQPGE